jgi:Flp pilus assembly protein TadG
MRIGALLRDSSAASAVEFGITAPAFFAALLGAFELGMLLWSQVTLQHATELAARCASVNPAVCSSVTATQAYAAQQALGLTVPASTFSVSSPACGNQVTASYDFMNIAAMFGIPKITLNAKSCFPR